MFRNALLIAPKFTFPVVMSRLSWDGMCSSSIGAFVVVNKEGWAVTANHILEQIKTMQAETQSADAYRKSVADANALPEPKAKNAALKKLSKPAAKSTQRFSVWWGGVATKTVQMVGIEDADVGLVQFEDLDVSKVEQFPVFKDPTKDFEPGTSLCKLGFPFHSFTPSWDGAAFHLPSNALPLARFPMDGMFTRTINLPAPDPATPPAFPLRWVETSTPGLKGQSGGPTFDVNGTIWAIQCKTLHLSLGFDPPVPGGNGAKEHQFLNVGVGVHPDTLFGMFNLVGAAFQVSTY